MLQQFNTGTPGPKTHVLLIGVGGYKYLKGGTDSKPQGEGLEELGQLTSPVVSTAAMYNKMLEYNDKNEWCKPLGSIEILATPPPGMAIPLPGLTIENAGIDNIIAAYESWKHRCDQNEDNVAILYYCGHGFQKQHHFLLADDFGKNPNMPWRGSFNFDYTRDAFYGCKARTQVHFVDSCRQVTYKMLETALTIPPLDDPSLLNPAESVHHMTLKATASGESAYGKKNEVAYFTQAVINGMDGLVARQDENDEWVVETGELGTKIFDLMGLIDPKQAEDKYRCQVYLGMPVGILKRKDPPTAWLEISCNPDGALPVAGLTCREDEANTTNIHQRAPMPQTWKLNLKVAHYKVEASFKAGSGYKDVEKKASLIPPVKKIKLSCEP